MAKNKQRRRLVWAIMASLLLHFVIAFSLAAFSGTSVPDVDLEDKPPELTLVEPPPPAPTPPPNPAYMETADVNKAPEPPKEKTFQSNANSVAASEQPGTSDEPLPTTNGKDQPYVQVTSQNLALASEGEKPQPPPQPKPVETPPPPTPRPSATPPPTATPSPPPESTPPPEQFAMLAATPPPAFTPPEEVEATPTPAIETKAVPPVPRPRPERPDSSFQAMREQTRMTGRITNRGRPSLNAAETPLGRYQKIVSDAIGSRWYHYVNSKIDLVSIGTAHIEAQVGADGKIQNLRVLSNNANEAFANICLQSFQEAQIPPIPEELVSALPDGKLPVDIYFTTYANR